MLENPFKTWWKARQYFKFPKIKISFNRVNTGLFIKSKDILWKDKFNSPRIVEFPYIKIGLLNYEIVIEFNHYKINEFGEKEEINYEYWEHLLKYLYYDHSLKIDSYWEFYSKIQKKPICSINQIYYLTKEGLHKLKEYYE